MTTDEYIAKVYTKYLTRRQPREWKSKNIIPRQCELDLLQRVARAVQGTRRNEVDIGSIANQVIEDHGLPVTSDESNTQRTHRVESLIKHVFERESLLMTYVSGVTRHLKFTDYQVLKAYRDYVCEKTNQDPDGFVDLMKWHISKPGQSADKVSPTEIAREFGWVLERESGLSDASVTIDGRSLKMHLQRSDLVALEKQYHDMRL
ncbi:hypothetical protein NW759_002817 [Fusarium solani]|nr:hypothetical protein NW759_002817 [Fusarium solani]